MYNPNFNEEADRRRMQNEFKRKFPEEYRKYNAKCPEGSHWVKGYNKDGKRVKGHCAKDPIRR
ncbi:MAG: hypothetical protein ACYDAP_00315 [Thermoplasmataceae archaeon]